MPYAPATARLTVDLDALAANYRLLVGQSGRAEVAPVVKADGYGMGAAPVARRLWAEGARTFFTARVAGGEHLREFLGPDRPATIYVLDGCPDAQAARLHAADLIPVLSSVAQAAAWQAYSRGIGVLPAALHVDTGMNRLGVRPEELEAMALSPDRLAGLDVRMVMSHLACGGEPGNPMNRRQRDRFAEAAALFPNARASLANSGGSFLGDDYLFDLTRPGVTLYGGGPEERFDPRVKAVATLEAEILQVRAVPPGETVGYGGGWAATRPTRAATVGIGYADGVLRANSPNGSVWFAGAERPLLGRVSMDLMTVDVTGCDDARPGERVELFGAQLPVDTAAARAGTIAYELLTRIGPRVERRYLGAVE
ncbi:alanine racemase [Caulobacter sp. 17J80-11]|uniref:alanine racemase n=1 Tax=Caulobacter sp. 17J80-11 TaxID=2763502 RepID=UPI001653B658|nr:alanine racemase [Caulobacter sp. 17J80-11]MBC6983002.1 alanine racemase [Caulobacter sp. 17J80-11]